MAHNLQSHINPTNIKVVLPPAKIQQKYKILQNLSLFAEQNKDDLPSVLC